jgi:hypothetical protein
MASSLRNQQEISQIFDSPEQWDDDRKASQ